MLWVMCDVSIGNRQILSSQQIDKGMFREMPKQMYRNA